MKNALLITFLVCTYSNLISLTEDRIILVNGIKYSAAPADFETLRLSLEEKPNEAEVIVHDLTEENNKTESEQEAEKEKLKNSAFWTYFLICLVLVCFAGLMSGLTVGYLSIDDLVLELKAEIGSEEEKQAAAIVLPILANKHLLLVTLLVWNAAAMEALPIFINKLVSELVAILMSVSLLLVFGEVIPQAVCAGPDQIKIAAFITPLINKLILVSYPLCYPIAKVLDYILGEHHKSRFKNTDLKTLIELHTFNALKEVSENHEQEMEDKGLDAEQANLMINTIEARKVQIKDIVIDFEQVFMLDYDEPIDSYRLHLIMDRGFSRIPVYCNGLRNNVIGILRIKSLLGKDLNNPISLRDMKVKLNKPEVAGPNLNVFELLESFKQGKSHMAIITEDVEKLKFKFDNFSKEIENLEEYTSIRIIGIVTMENVIEKLIKIDILDEDDYLKMKSIGGRKNRRTNSGFEELTKSLFKEETLKHAFGVTENRVPKYYNKNEKKSKYI